MERYQQVMDMLDDKASLIGKEDAIVSPKNGDKFVVVVGRGIYKSRLDARVDGLPWTNAGSIKAPRLRDIAPRFRKTLFHTRGGTRGFQKEVWEELQPTDTEVVIIFYDIVDSEHKSTRKRKSNGKAADSSARPIDLEKLSPESDEKATNSSARPNDLEKLSRVSRRKATNSSARPSDLEKSSRESNGKATISSARPNDLEKLSRVSRRKETNSSARPSDLEELSPESNGKATISSARRSDLEKLSREKVTPKNVDIRQCKTEKLMRDANQWYNQKVAENLSKIDSNMIYGITSIAKTLPHFVQAFQFVNGLANCCAILFNETAMEIGGQVTELSGNQILSYDTPFKLANFYVSVLLCRLTCLEGSPVFPIAFFLHSQTFEAPHTHFWQFLKYHPSSSWLENQRIVEDLEVTLNADTLRSFPEMKLACCWNHIDSNVRRFLEDKVSPNRVRFYRDQVKDLLSTSEENSFDDLLKKVSGRWNSDFFQYFKDELATAIRERAAVFALEKMKYPNHHKRITVNNSESLNNVLKPGMDFKEIKVDVLVLVLHEFQSFYMAEFKKAVSGEGQWQLMSQFKDLVMKSFAEPNPLQMDLTEMTDTIRDTLERNTVQFTNPKPRPSSTLMAEHKTAQDQVKPRSTSSKQPAKRKLKPILKRRKSDQMLNRKVRRSQRKMNDDLDVDVDVVGDVDEDVDVDVVGDVDGDVDVDVVGDVDADVEVDVLS